MQKQNKYEVQIIKLLKADSGGGEYLSGQKISDSLEISRTAVWKHIKNLRDVGYQIESSSKKGYLLVKDAGIFNNIEILSELDTDFVGRSTHFFDEVESTNKTAFELANTGAEEGTVVIARSQTDGKGRLGRKWESPKFGSPPSSTDQNQTKENNNGINIYTSIILRPRVSPTEAQSITLLTAVVAAETINKFTNKRPNVKWPNDILIEGKKVAGILTEMKTDTDSVDFIVIGLGINVNLTQSDMADMGGEIKQVATSVLNHSDNMQTGTKVSLSEVATTLYSNMEKWYKVFLNQGIEPILKEWEAYFDSVGKVVNVISANSFSGICMGIDSRGALLVREKDGNIKTVVAGDVEHARVGQ